MRPVYFEDQDLEGVNIEHTYCNGFNDDSVFYYGKNNIT